MVVLAAVLTIGGLALLLWLAVAAFRERTPPAPPPPEADLAAPYREGLHAAIRMQGVAQDLEQQLYAEALRQAEAEAPDSHAPEQP